jgi:hypothetical protein
LYARMISLESLRSDHSNYVKGGHLHGKGNTF